MYCSLVQMACCMQVHAVQEGPPVIHRLGMGQGGSDGLGCADEESPLEAQRAPSHAGGCRPAECSALGRVSVPT